MTTKKMGLAVCLENKAKDYDMLLQKELNGVWPEYEDDPTYEYPLMDEYIEEKHFGVDFTEIKTKEG